MRHKTFKRGGYTFGVVSSSGGETDGKVILSRNPVGVKEAVTKSYIDVNLSMINSGQFNYGTVPLQRLPAFTGDLSKPEGDGVVNLKPSGTTSGVFTKVTVTNRGIVVSADNLVEQDISNVSWNNINTGKPTLLSGYGITDALSITGGSASGVIGITEVGGDRFNLVNKDYLESISEAGNGVSVGGISLKTTSITPPGYLRCNGGEVSKAMYTELYAVIGDRFSKDVGKSGGRPWLDQSGINGSTNSAISFSQQGDFIKTFKQGTAIVTKGRVYVFNTDDGTNNNVPLYATAIINSNGTIGAWQDITASQPVVSTIKKASVIALNNVVVILGGVYGNGLPSNTVLGGVIESDGIISEWRNIALWSSLPKNLSSHSTVIFNNRVYLAGGHVDGDISKENKDIYYYDITDTGFNGSWVKDNLKLDVVKNLKTIKKVGNSLIFFSQDNGLKLYKVTTNRYGNLTQPVLVHESAIPDNQLTVNESSVVITTKKLFIPTLINGTSSGFLTADIDLNGDFSNWGTVSTTAQHTLATSFVTYGYIYSLGGTSLTNGNAVPTVSRSVFSGGSNDYSQRYGTGTYNVSSSDNFRLPGVLIETEPMYSYIRY